MNLEKISIDFPKSSLKSSKSFTEIKDLEKITILGKEFDLDIYLNDTTRFHLAQIDFHGILFYKSLKNMNFNFYIKELSEYLDSMLASFERNSQLENILEKIN